MALQWALINKDQNMSGIRYTKELKIAAVKQVTECGYKRNKVAERLGAMEIMEGLHRQNLKNNIIKRKLLGVYEIRGLPGLHNASAPSCVSFNNPKSSIVLMLHLIDLLLLFNAT